MGKGYSIEHHEKAGTIPQKNRQYKDAKQLGSIATFRLAAPSPPHWLDHAATDRWNSLAPELLQQGLLKEVDVPVFAVYCQSYSDYIKWQTLLQSTNVEDLKKLGTYGVRMAEAWKQLNQSISHLCYSPGTRARLFVDIAQADTDIYDDEAKVLQFKYKGTA